MNVSAIQKLLVQNDENLEAGIYCERLDWLLEKARQCSVEEYNSAMDWAINEPTLKWIK